LKQADGQRRYERELRRALTVELIESFCRVYDATSTEVAESVLRIHTHSPLVRAPGSRTLPTAEIQRVYEYVKGQRRKPFGRNEALDAAVRGVCETKPRIMHALMLTLMSKAFETSLSNATLEVPEALVSDDDDL
jgi:hypothetical protein